jgi:hypothetical protein
MTARVAYVPVSTVLRHPHHDLRASAYVLNEPGLQHREKAARNKLMQGLTGLQSCASERAAVLAFQAENDIKEIQV